MKYFIDFKLFNKSFPLVKEIKSNINVKKFIFVKVDLSTFKSKLFIILLNFEIIISLSATFNKVIELFKTHFDEPLKR